MPVLGGGSGGNVVAASSVTPPLPAVEGIRLWAFGHSYLSNGADPNTNQQFVNRFAYRYKTQTIIDQAVAGSNMAQTLAQIQSTWQINSQGLVVLCSLINDVNGSTPAATLAEIFRSCLAYLNAQALLASNSTAFAYSAGWSSGITTTVGSYVDFGWVGDTAYLLVPFAAGASGTITITNSGTSTPAQTINTGGWGTSFTGAIKLSGYGAGAHTVRVTLTAGSGVTITGAAILSPSPAVTAWVREGAIPGYTSTQNTTLTSAYPAALAPVAADFPAVIVVGVDGTWDNATMIGNDNVHPNDKGRSYYATLLANALVGRGFVQGQNFVNNSTSAAATYTGTTPNFVTAPTVPGAPTLAVAPGNAQNVLTWGAAANNGSTVTSYKVYSGSASGNETLLATLGNVLTYTDTGLTNGTARYYKVSAVNGIGEGPQSSEVSGTPGAPTAPTAPLLLTTSPGDTQVSLAWTAPSSNGGSAITDYIVQYRVTSVGGAWSTFADGTSTSTGAIVTGLTNTTGYDFQVAAVNAIGTGPYSSAATGTPVASFNPSSVASLAAWYKADSLALSDGAAVTSWGDSSGTGLTLGTGGGAPTYKTGGPNGKPYVRFVRASTQYLVSSARTVTNNYTYFVVMAVTGSNSQFDIQTPTITVISGYTGGIVESFQSPRQTLGAWTNGVFAVFEYLHPASAGTSLGFENGTQNSTGTAQNPSAGATQAFSVGGTASNPADVNIAEILYYEAALNTTDRGNIRAYLGTKYGITVS